MKPMCEACERLALENDQLRDAVTIWQKLADERRAQIDAQSERLVALSEKPLSNAAPQAPGSSVSTGAQGEGAVSRTSNGEPLSLSTAIASPAVAAPLSATREQIPAELFDSYAVLEEIERQDGIFPAPAMVATVLDAAVRLIRRADSSIRSDK